MTYAKVPPHAVEHYSKRPIRKGNLLIRVMNQVLFVIPQKAALADWKKVKVWMMMMIAASLMWAGAAEKPD